MANKNMKARGRRADILLYPGPTLGPLESGDKSEALGRSAEMYRKAEMLAGHILAKRNV